VEGSVSYPLVAILQAYPVNSTGGKLHRSPRPAAVAPRLATLPMVSLVAWDGQSVDLFVDLNSDVQEADLIQAVEQVLTRPRSWTLHLIVDPSEWDWALPEVQSAAREALQGRHQCQGRRHCYCGCRGVQFPQQRISSGVLKASVAGVFGKCRRPST